MLKSVLIILVGLVSAQAHAYQMLLVSNSEVAQTWNRSTSGESSGPVVAEAADGSAQIEWKNSANFEAYSRLVSSPQGATTSAYTSGNYIRADYETDLRRIEANKDTDFFQASLTHTDDNSVLSRKPNQINNLQLGRSTESYYVAGGDASVNFSSLGSALGIRGVQAQRAISNVLVTGYAGVVADSWDAVANAVPRSTFLRNTFGAKLEKQVSETINVYITGQNGQDQSDSITDPSVVAGSLNARKISNYTTGFDYKSTDRQWNLSVETAISHTDIDTQAAQNGQASIIDGGWKGAALGLQLGYHALSDNFSSLSSKASPGIDESYASGDWKATSWLKLVGSLRRSRNATPAVGFTAAQKTETNSNSLSANLTLIKDISLSLQKSKSATKDLVANSDTQNDQSQATLRYSGSGWLATATYGEEAVRTVASPTTDSDSVKTRFLLGKSLSNASENEEATWLVDLKAEVASQIQKIVSGGNTVNNTRSISAEAQFLDIGSVALTLSDAVTTRPNNLADLKSNTRTAEFAKEFNNKSKMRLYVKNSVTNEGDDTLRTFEQAFGAQYNFTF